MDECDFDLNGTSVSGRCLTSDGMLYCGGNEALLKAVKVSTAGPSLAIYSDLAKAEATLKAAMEKLAAPPMGADMAALMKEVTDAEAARKTRQDNVTKYKKWGFNTDLGGMGYTCQPATGGYCYARCDGAASAGSGSWTTKIDVPDPRDPSKKRMRQEDHTFVTDNRCGGDNLMGYQCLAGTGRGDKQRVCLRGCNTQNTIGHNQVACDYELNRVDGGGVKAFMMSSRAPEMPVHQGQQCFAAAGVTGCQWNPDFEPRNPKYWPRQ
jgi:hypothetical protein